MNWTLGVTTDGRVDYLAQTLASAAAMLPEPDRRIIVDDSGRADCTAWIRETYPEWETDGHRSRKGLAATVRDLWGQIDTDYLFHLEDDFTFNWPVPVDAMAEALDKPALAQVCLVRQPWSPVEHRAGSILPARMRKIIFGDRHIYLEHDRSFSLNPCLIPRDVYELGWDDDNEAGFTELLRAKGYRFAYWGDGVAWVTHIGERSSVFGGAGRR